ncbi:hypothetical protein JL722_796 [Aureococcus anophagefferens]|nr:hypothetical protein JL722_796 [Aureococcus anophagefferens]
MTACARCAALLVACCVVGAGSQAPPRPILAVSVSRSGGGTLCDLACRQFHGGPDMDCRLEGGAFHYLKALNGSVADHNLTFAATARAMAADAALCNAVVVEPGRRLGAGARAVLDAAAAAPAGASLWTAYAWLLLVRDPIKRFVSYAAKTRGLDRRLDAAGFRAAVRGGGSEGDRRQLRNFATRHLLPGARFNATADACAPDVLAAALAVLPRYAAVLNLADLPGESYFVLGAVVGLEAAEPPRAAAPETAAAYAKARGYDLDGEALGLLRLANLCDLEVVAGRTASSRSSRSRAATRPESAGRGRAARRGHGGVRGGRAGGGGVDAVEDEARRRGTLWVAFKRVVAASRGRASTSGTARRRGSGSRRCPRRRRRRPWPCSRPPRRRACWRTSAADPAGPDAGRRLCYTCPYRAAPPWPPGRPKVAITFAWTREPTFRFISGYYTETSIGHLAHLPHFAVATEPAPARTSNLRAPVLKSVGQNCGHRFDYVWPLEDGTAPLWRLLEARVGLAGLAAAAEAAGFHHKHDAGAIVGARTAAALADQDENTQRRFRYSQRAYDAANAAKRVAFESFGAITPATLPIAEVAELRDEVARLTKLLAEKAVDAPKPSGPPTKPKPRRCKGKVCF